MRIARLEARVKELEAALERRSDLLRRLQRHLTNRDLLLLSRLEDGLSPIPRGAHDLASWEETTELTPAEVEEAVTDLWTSLAVWKPTGGGAS